MAQVHNLADLTLLVGTVPIEGFGENDAISVERAEDSFSMTTGADGETTFNAANNKSGTITITLMQNSFSNTPLQTILLLDEETGSLFFPLSIIDPSGGWVIAATQCKIMRSPNKPFNKNVGELQWVIGAESIIEAPLGTDFLDEFTGLLTV